MDQSSTYARHFSRLVWLLLNEGGSVDEQKMALRALVQVSKVGAVELVADNRELRAGDAVVPTVLTGVGELVSQMASHSVKSIAVDEGTGPADLLGFARIIASAPSVNDGGANVSRKLRELSAAGIRIETVPADGNRPSEGATMPMTPIADAAPPVPATETPPATVVSETQELPVAKAPEPASPPAPPPVAAAAPVVTPALKQMSEASAALLAQLAGRAVSTLPPEELLDLLAKALAGGDIPTVTKVLDDLVTLAEHSARVGKPKAVADILHGVLQRNASLKDGDLRAAVAVALKKLAKPALLRAVAGILSKHPERKQIAFEVLRDAGEDGADAVVEQVGQARNSEERASLVEVLVELPDAVPALVRMLGDARWFVVRNAADLLGEMAAKKAEGPLVNLLKHSDDRVRRSATNALLKLGTPDAIKSVYEAVGDESPEVRMQVAAALGSRKDSKTSVTLIRAIDGEDDADVQLAMIAALGKVATPEAVQKLVRLAEAEKGLFKKKDNTLRIAAILALGEARSPAALNTLKELSNDKDKEVRETATRTLAQAGR